MSLRAKIPWIILTVLALLGLSGCLTLEARTRLRSDGSAERTVVIAVDSVLLQTAAVDPLETLRGSTEASGWQVERYQDPTREQAGLRLHRMLTTLEDLNHLPEGDPLAGLEQVSLGEEGEFQTLSVTLSIAGILDRLRLAAGEPPFSTEELALLRAAELRLLYEVELPGPIMDYSPRSGAQVEGRRIRWLVPLNPDQPAVSLRATWRPVRPVPGCTGGAIGLLAIWGAIRWRPRKKGRPL